MGGDVYSLSSDRNPTQSLRKQIGPAQLAGSRLTARRPIIETGMASGALRRSLPGAAARSIEPAERHVRSSSWRSRVSVREGDTRRSRCLLERSIGEKIS